MIITTNTDIYHEVMMHYSKQTDDCFEYTSNKRNADEICVFTQIRDINTDELIDGTDEKEFPNTDEGRLQAEVYANSLVEKYEIEGYELY
jgi:hypothetical protein